MSVRSERRVMYEQSRAILVNAGYQSIGRIRLNRYGQYRMLTIACNIIGRLTHRDVMRIWQYLLYKHSKLMRGSHYRPGRVVEANHEALREWEEQEEPLVCCPRCGCNLLDEGPVTPDEIKRAFEAYSRTSSNELEPVVEPARNATQSPTMSD